ncbi:C-GCAxxG-C-C family (seleno)protein [Labilibacter marinus]|uniref:C-GCAxxG-C-C family (seleno)protein n=1 Tax=Labilibacter marinus TaxID=1477105 RepID=UPI000833C494|nr:C-GCAxxG-C-C family (seleno)protein [Labilibacter marinus]
MNKGELAEKLYHGEEGYNCAQAIFKTFQSELKIDEQTILEAKNSGRGKADGGTCGALYAALKLTTSDEVRKKLESTFISKAGSTLCKTIRANRRLSCKGCVRVAAETTHQNF